MSLLSRYPDKRNEREKREAAEAAARTREVGLRGVAAILFFGLAGIVVFEVLAPERAWPVVVLSLAGAMVALVPWDVWRALLSRIEQAQIGPVSVGLRRDVQDAAANAPPSDNNEGGGKAPDGKARSMLDLRLRLESKLTYVAKYLLGTPESPESFTIGSLEFDGYLTKLEARTALGILSAGDERLRALSPEDRDSTLIEAEKFVDGVRASIFWGMVRRMLRGENMPGAPGLWLGDIDGKGRRKDMLAGESGREFWVAPAFAIDAASTIKTSAVERLSTEERPYGVPRARRIVVVPDRSLAPEGPPGDSPRVVRLANLRAALTERQEGK